MGTSQQKYRGISRRGLAPIEVVMVTGVMFPSLAFLLYLGLQVCRNYFSVAGSMMGSPF
jgi:hypothetical protein